MFKKFFILIIGVLIAFSGYIAMQPNDFRIERSIVLSASAEDVFNQVNEPKKMNSWSPWLELDPKQKISYSGPDAGVGAIAAWSGNQEVGEGKETIIETIPNELVKTKLEFILPMEATYFGEFIIKKKNDEQVELTWAMYGTNDFLGKAMNVILDCNNFVGSMFEKGLNNLKIFLEKKAES